MADPHPISSQLSLMVRAKLREELPYMKQEKVDEVARLCKVFINDHIEAAKRKIEASKSRISIMSLPRELRNHIFEPVLLADDHGDAPGILIADHTTEINTHHPDRLLPRLHEYEPNTKWMVQPALTHVSKEIRAETLPVYYGANTFCTIVFDAFDLETETCKGFVWLGLAERWLTTIGPENRRLIKQFMVRHASNVVELSGGVIPRLNQHAAKCGGDGVMLHVPMWSIHGIRACENVDENRRRCENWVQLNIEDGGLLEMGQDGFQKSTPTSQATVFGILQEHGRHAC